MRISFADFVIGDESAMVVAWRLLEALLLAYEEPKLTRFHKAVTAKIMSLDVVLPYWLECSYKVSEVNNLSNAYEKCVVKRLLKHSSRFRFVFVE